MKVIFSLLLLTFSMSTMGQVVDEDCDVIKSATRFYERAEGNVESYYVVKDGIWFYEFTNSGRQYIKSRMVWLPDCTYQLTMVETNIPNFDLSAGAMITVKITGMVGNEVTYEYLPEGVLPGGVLIIEQ